MALGQLDEMLPIDPIIHELTHYNTANSVVNEALQLRWLALLRLGLSSPWSAVDPVVKQMASDLAATEALLHPIAEGLAEFAEFDCSITDPASQLPTTAYDAIAVRLLSLRSNMTTALLTDLYQASAAGKRAAAQVERRVEILSHPMRPSAPNEVYLLGYLAVKAAWNIYIDEGGLYPAGTFIDFLEYWFYEDWRLAAIIANPESGTVDAVALHLRSRAMLLLASGIADRVATFVRDKYERQGRRTLLRGPEELANGPFAGLELSNRDVSDGIRALNRFRLNRIGPQAPIYPDRGPIIEDYINLTYRYLVTVVPPTEEATQAYVADHPDAVGAPVRLLDFVLELAERKRSLGLITNLPVWVEVDRGRLAALRSEDGEWRSFSVPMNISVPFEADIADGTYTARLFGFVMSTSMPWSVHWLLFGGARFVGGWTYAAAKPADSRHLVHVVQREQELAELLPERISDLAASTAEVFGDDSEPAVRNATLGIGAIIRDVLKARVPSWAPLLGAPARGIDGGIRNLIPKRLVQALAVIGLVNAYSTAWAEVATQLTVHGLDPNEVMRSFDEVAAATGIRLIEADPAGHTIRARI